MHRFFVDPALLTRTGTTIALPEKVAHQVRDVLHIMPDEQLVLLDDSGDEALCTVTKSTRTSVEVQLLERRAGKSEPAVRIILCQGLLKSARFEWILEKGTELGVTAFAPILCYRSLAGLEQTGSAKVQRWQRIIQEAAEQCGRSRLPALSPIRPLISALNDIPVNALALMPWEEETAHSLRDICASPPATPITVVLFIGPEGGLTTEEVALARQHGVHIITLGTRILRAETAALAAVANIMYALETS